jgi:hypothetical protein
VQRRLNSEGLNENSERKPEMNLEELLRMIASEYENELGSKKTRLQDAKQLLLQKDVKPARSRRIKPKPIELSTG